MKCYQGIDADQNTRVKIISVQMTIKKATPSHR